MPQPQVVPADEHKVKSTKPSKDFWY